MEQYKIPICTGVGETKNPKYMLVGYYGGRLGCQKTGVPFTKDGSGKLFIRAMRSLGYTTAFDTDEAPWYKTVYVTNLVKSKCITEDGLNRDPNNDELHYWLGQFNLEHKRVAPHKVVAIGNVVYETLLFGGYRDMLKIKHPSYYLRNGALRGSSNAWTNMLDEYTKVLGKNI